MEIEEEHLLGKIDQASDSDDSGDLAPEIEIEPSEAEDASWKDTLRAVFESALADMDAEEGAEAAALLSTTEQAGDDDNEPDLYSFYEALAALRGEQRAGNRKTADALTRFSQVLGTLDAQLAEMKESARARTESAEPTGVSDNFCVGLAVVYDRVGRIRDSFANPPKPPLFGGGAWLKAWQSMREAVAILSSHLEELLAEAGMEKTLTTNEPFDPTSMRAVGVHSDATGLPSNTVSREIASGWSRNGRIISPAEVEIYKSS